MRPVCSSRRPPGSITRSAPVGSYDWLNRSIFLSTLVDVPEPMRVAKGPEENDRLIQVHRVY